MLLRCGAQIKRHPGGRGTKAAHDPPPSGQRLLGAVEYTLDQQHLRLLQCQRDPPVEPVRAAEEPSVSFEIRTSNRDTNLTLSLERIQSAELVTFYVVILVLKAPRGAAGQDAAAAASKSGAPIVTFSRLYKHVDERAGDSGTIKVLDFGQYLGGTLWCDLARIQVKIQVFSPVRLDGVRRALAEARLAGEHCDALLCVQGAELPAHRLVLATASAVFARMFAGGFREAADGRVDVQGASRAAVERFLEYLYTDGDGAADWAGLEVELLELAERYAVPRLKADCALRLWLADAPRALALLREADAQPLFGSGLRRRWLRVVADGFREVDGTAEWEAFEESNPLAADAVKELGYGSVKLVTSSLCD